jgi:hypothetical protein
MSTQITVELPDHLYERAQALAAEQEQEVAEIITLLLQNALAAKSLAHGHVEMARDLLQEAEAFVASHEALQEQYFGSYVALLHGKVVDHDREFGAIMQRVKAKYPSDAVLVRKVEKAHTRIINLRSPRYSLRE